MRNSEERECLSESNNDAHKGTSESRLLHMEVCKEKFSTEVDGSGASTQAQPGTMLAAFGVISHEGAHVRRYYTVHSHALQPRTSVLNLIGRLSARSDRKAGRCDPRSSTLTSSRHGTSSYCPEFDPEVLNELTMLR